MALLRNENREEEERIMINNPHEGKSRCYLRAARILLILFVLCFLFPVVRTHAANSVPAGSLVTAREFHTATLLSNGKVLVAGGYTGGESPTLSSAELYDPTIDSWSATGSLIFPRYNHTATLLPNGKVLVTGGLGSGGMPIGFTELYDPVSNSWSMTGSLLQQRAAHTATLLTNGKVLVAGGNAGTLAELFDPATGVWSPAGNMSTARLGHTATLLPNGKVLVAGGYVNSSNSYFSSAELYDPESNSWSSASSMATARMSHTATLTASGNVFVAGGMNGSGVVSSDEIYDLATNFWTVVGTVSASFPYINFTATLLPNGSVLLAGGSSSMLTGEPVSNASMTVYDPDTNSLGSGWLSIARYGHTATLLPSGKVLIVGGYNDGNGVGFLGYLSSTELYDPSAGSIMSTGSLVQSRTDHTATTLPDGTTLVAGGNANGSFLSCRNL